MLTTGPLPTSILDSRTIPLAIPAITATINRVYIYIIILSLYTGYIYLEL